VLIRVVRRKALGVGDGAQIPVGGEERQRWVAGIDFKDCRELLGVIGR
jgi:hypothetical protein